jgi:hypothetical protein
MALWTVLANFTDQTNGNLFTKGQVVSDAIVDITGLKAKGARFAQVGELSSLWVTTPLGKTIPVLTTEDGKLIVDSSSTAIDAATSVSMLALGKSLVVSAASATLLAAAATIDSSAPTATYYVQVIDSAAAVDGSSAIVALARPIKVQHVVGVDDYVSFADSLPVVGVAAANGIVIQLSTTLGTGTLVGGNYLLANGAKK